MKSILIHTIEETTGTAEVTGAPPAVLSVPVAELEEAVGPGVILKLEDSPC